MDELLDSYYDMYGCTVTREVFPYAERIRYRISEAVDIEAVKKNIEKGAKKAADPKFTRKDVEHLHNKRRETVRKLVKEEVDTIIAYLVDNNFAKTEKAARNIMEAMSENWIQSILDEEVH
jgi:FixJ family two-component response regulator